MLENLSKDKFLKSLDLKKFNIKKFKNKKVAFLGNQNGANFCIAQFLKDLDLDVKVFPLIDDLLHFGPQNDTVSLSSLKIVDYQLFNDRLIKIKELKEYDLLIGNGYAPALCSYNKLNLDLFLPNGADFWSYPEITIGKIIRKERLKLLYHQRLGLKKVKNIIYYLKDSPYLRVLKKRCPNAEIDYKVSPQYYYPEIPEIVTFNNTYKTHWASDFLSLASENDFIIFHWGRISFSDRPYPKCRGTDIAIKGFYEYIMSPKKKAKKPKLILIEYGPDIYRAKQLINELNIDNYVTFMPPMTRKDIIFGLYQSSLALGHFGVGYDNNSVLNESFLVGKPILSQCDSSHIPCITASKKEDICTKLLSLEFNKNQSMDYSNKAQDWILKEYANSIISILNILS